MTIQQAGKLMLKVGVIVMMCIALWNIAIFEFSLFHNAPTAYATIPPEPQTSGSGSTSGGSTPPQTGNYTNPYVSSTGADCSCLSGVESILKDIKTDTGNIATFTSETASNTNAIKDYLKQTLMEQEGLAMKYIDTYSSLVFSEIQAKKGDCDSYKAMFGAVAPPGQEQVCRSFVDNWKYAEEDIPKNVRKDVAQEIQRSTNFLTTNQVQSIVDQVPLLQDQHFQNNFTDNIISELFAVQLPNGQIAQVVPNTTLAGALYHNIYFNSQRLVQIVQGNTDQRIAQSTQEFRDQAAAGQGALSLDEPVYDITDARTGQIIGHQYSSNTTETMMNQLIRSAVTAGLDKALNSTFSPGISGNFFSSYDAATGLYSGGIAALRGLGNSANGGPGFFATGPASANVPLPAICYVSFADASKTLGVEQMGTETATLTLVGKTKMQDITFTADNNTIVNVSPLSITPPVGQEQTTPQYFSVTLKGLKPGTTNVNATVSITNTSTICQTDSPLVMTVQDACAITTNPQLFMPTDLTGLIWNNVDSPRENFSLQIPTSITINKNTDAGLSFGSMSNTSENPLVASSSPNFMPKSLFSFFDTFAQASTTVTLLGPGTTTIDMVATTASSTSPLCSTQIPTGIGSRCFVQACQSMTPLNPPIHTCVDNQETTQFCDSITGYQAADQNNAWCVDAVPAKYQNICATQ